MQSFLGSHHHLLSFIVQVVRLSAWLAIITAVFVPLEYFFAVRRTKLFRKGWTTISAGTSSTAP